MKDKAKINLKVSKALLELEKKRPGGGVADSAMSRLYYALFQAGVQAMVTNRIDPKQYSGDAKEADSSKWSHTVLRNNASRCRGNRNDRGLFSLAFSLRERADYSETLVSLEQVTHLLPEIEEFLEETCK